MKPRQALEVRDLKLHVSVHSLSTFPYHLSPFCNASLGRLGFHSEKQTLLSLHGKGHSFEWIEFRRGRKGDPDQLGYGFRIEFEKPVVGPISMGYGAHYGLGLFMPERSEND